MDSAVGILNPESFLPYEKSGKPGVALSQCKKGLTGHSMSVRKPFNKVGEIDYKALQKQIDSCIDKGAHAVIFTYGDSLFSILPDDQMEKIWGFPEIPTLC